MAEQWRSKFSTRYNKSDIEKWDASLKMTLAGLRKELHNRKCFDCGAEDSSWASPKLGIFICLKCSDVHRAVGTHITFVKNFSTYLWGLDEVELMKAVGNARGKAIYGESMVDASASKDSKVVVCTDKYGSPRVQGLIAEQISRAKTAAETSGAPSETAQAKSKGPASGTPRKEAQVKPSNDDWFDEMLSNQPAIAVSNPLVSKRAPDLQSSRFVSTEQGIDDFLDMCLGSERLL